MWPSVTQVLRLGGIVEESPYWSDPWYLTRGRLVHKAAELYDLGTLDPDSVAPEIAAYLEAWIRFRKETGFESRGIEVRGMSEAFKILGRCDRWGWRGKRRMVVDLKSGGEPSWVGLQLAGYASILGETVDPALVAADRVSVRLMADGKYRMRRWDDPSDLHVFHGCASVAHWKLNRDRRVHDDGDGWCEAA